MNNAPADQRSANDLRQAFDHSFALPPRALAAEVDDLLSIHLAGERYAVRLRDIAMMVASRAVVPVPSAVPALLGLVGIRGRVVPVFSLAAILGHEHATGAPRWLVVCGAEEPIAFGFSHFEGYVRLARSSVHSDENPQAARQYVHQMARTDTGMLAVINIPLVVATIRNRIGPSRPTQES